MSIFDAPEFDNHENVVFINDKESGLKAIIAIHNTQFGPALGGCRMFDYASEREALRDVLRLSRGMTYKAALAQVPLGGGKSVIIGNPATQKSDALFRALGRHVERLGGNYVIAQDSGTSPQDLKLIAEETRFVAGIDKAVDDHNRIRSGDPSPATAYGVFMGIKAALKHKLGSGDINGIAVAIQGVGNVGFALAQQLYKAGAKLYVADINPANVARAVSECGAIAVDNADIYRQKVDVISPCALGATINDESIEHIVAPIIAGSANNQLERDDHGLRLHERGILYAPDFVISAGGLIHVHFLRNKRTWAEATAHVGKIADTLTEIFSRSQTQKETTSHIANELALERLQQVGAQDNNKLLGVR